MKYEFLGKKYTTLSSCYEANQGKVKVGIATVRKRLRDGYDLESALLMPKKKTLNTVLGEHIVEGVVYENLPGIADEYGIPLNTIYKRYSRGCRGDDLVPEKKRKSYKEPLKEASYRFFAGGVGYKSAAEACRKHGVKYVTYRSRLRKGYTVEQALNIDIVLDGREARGNKYNVDGKLRTISELSQLYSTAENTIRDRLKRGATIREAIGLDEIIPGSLKKRSDLEKKKKNPIKLEVNGKIYRNYKSLADEYGLVPYVLRQRIVDYGYSPEEAVSIDGKSKPIMVAGVTYPSKASLAEAYGLTPAVLLARLAGESTIEQALGIETKETSRSVQYEGESFSSLTELAEKNGISGNVLSARMKSGLSLKEAIDAGKRITNSGRYNLTILDRDNDLANKPGLLYFVKIILNERDRYKIGITTQTVNKRLKSEGHEFKIIKVVNGTLLECFKLEQELIGLLSDKRDFDVSSEMLDGYSEIFRLNEDDVHVVLDLL